MQKELVDFNISTSSIDLHDQCPFRWAHKNVYKTEVPPQPIKNYTVVGNAFHKLMEEFYIQGAKTGNWSSKWLVANWEKILKLEAKGKITKDCFEGTTGGYDSKTIFYELLNKGYTNKDGHILKTIEKLEIDERYLKYHDAIKEVIEKELEKTKFELTRWETINGFSMIKKVYPMLVDHNWLRPPATVDKKIAVEFWFDFPYEGHDKYIAKAWGKIDLMILDDNEVPHILDWKTGKNSIDTVEESVQAIFYSAGLWKKFNLREEAIHFIYPQLDFVKSFLVEDGHYAIIRKKINAMFDSYHKKKYEKKENSNCKYCEFQHLCK